MSLSGWRPAVVRSLSSRKREPEFGPRRTTSSAEPGGSASTAAWSAAESALSPTSSGGASSPLIEIVDVSAAPAGGGVTRSDAPQLLQKRLSSGFACPHWVQNGIWSASRETCGGCSGTTAPPSLDLDRRSRSAAPRTLRAARGRINRNCCSGQASARRPDRRGSAVGVELALVARGVEQPVDGGGVVRADLEDPALAVRVGVDEL